MHAASGLTREVCNRVWGKLYSCIRPKGHA